MSNVIARRRAIAKTEYVTKARQIRDEITTMVMKEKIVSKRYRYVYSIPMIDICRTLNKNAISFYNCEGEDDEFCNLYNRKFTALMNMLDACDDLLDEMISVKRRFHVKLSIYEKVVGLIVDEQELIQYMIEDENEKHTNFLKNNQKNIKEN